MSWFNENFKRRIPVVIDTSITAKGTIDFAVSIPTKWDDFWDNVRTDGFDVVLADKDGTQFTFERLSSWNKSTRSGYFRVAGFVMTAGTVMHNVFLYWDNENQSSDLSSSVVVTSVKASFVYLGAPYGRVVQNINQSSLSTIPNTIFSKDPDEEIDIWFPYGQLLARRSQPYNEKLDFKGLDTINVEVLDSTSANQTGMYDLNETRIINGWIRLRIKAGTDNTDYAVRCIIVTTDSEKYIQSALLQVRKILPL